MNVRRLIAIVVCVALIGVIIGGRPLSVVHGAAAAKKTCKLVTKKVHGKRKKVRVCSNVKKATATATPTPIPTSTPTAVPTATPTATATNAPTSTATATATATPTSAGSARFLTVTQRKVDSLLDTETNVGATSSQYEFGGVDGNGSTVPTGKLFFWMWASEHNFGTSPYAASFLNFKLQGSDGTIYGAQAGVPQGEDPNLSTMGGVTLNQNQFTTGWVQFTVPNVKDVYTVLWTENGLFTSGVPITTVGLTPALRTGLKTED